MKFVAILIGAWAGAVMADLTILAYSYGTLDADSLIGQSDRVTIIAAAAIVGGLVGWVAELVRNVP